MVKVCEFNLHVQQEQILHGDSYDEQATQGTLKHK